MILLREYYPEDWAAIDDAVEPFAPPMATDDFLKMTKRGLSVTAVEDGKVMACGGLTYVNDEECVVWVKVSKKCLREPLKYARGIRTTFTLMMESVGDFIVSTYVLKDFCKGERLARLIGLKRTGNAKEYNGNTYYKYTAVI